MDGRGTEPVVLVVIPVLDTNAVVVRVCGRSAMCDGSSGDRTHSPRCLAALTHASVPPCCAARRRGSQVPASAYTPRRRRTRDPCAMARSMSWRLSPASRRSRRRWIRSAGVHTPPWSSSSTGASPRTGGCVDADGIRWSGEEGRLGPDAAVVRTSRAGPGRAVRRPAELWDERSKLSPDSGGHAGSTPQDGGRRRLLAPAGRGHLRRTAGVARHTGTPTGCGTEVMRLNSP